MTDDVRVSYGVKELLERMDRRLESIDRKLDAKASQADLVRLRDRVDTLETWQKLEMERDRQAGERFSRREKVLALFFTLLAVVVQFITHFGGLK